MLRILLCVIVFYQFLFAQSVIDSSQLKPNNTLFLQITFPQTDTVKTSSSRLRYSALTLPNAMAFVNGQSSKVYSSGAFVGLLNLNYGINKINFTAKISDLDSVRRQLIVIRSEPMKSSSRDTLVIEDALMLPSQDMWLSAGDILEVRFKGSPGWQASFEIPDVESDIEMYEQSTKEANGLSGIYIGRYTIKENDECKDVPIIFRLKKSFWSKEKKYTKAKISILSKELPRVAEVIGVRPFLNTGLGSDRLGGSKFGFLQSGVRLIVTGKIGSQYKIRLSENTEAWLPEEFAKILPLDTPLPKSLTGAIATSSNSTEDIVTISLSEKLAYSSEQLLNPNAIAVDIYGATFNTNWIAQNKNDIGIDNITCKQFAVDQFRMIVSLKHNHWGYDIDYFGNSLRLKIKRPPSVFKDSVLKNLTIAIDAGHGGDSKGAIGATGVFEKDITIIIAKHLENILKSKGAKVILTRLDNDNPYMNERIEKIISSKANILVSVHCNSAGESSDPLAIRGVSVYYKNIGYKNLADIVYENLLSLGLQQFGVVGSFNFMLNSITQTPNVLVETAFLSNPEEEILLLDDNFRLKIAEQIVDGLERYVKENADIK